MKYLTCSVCGKTDSPDKTRPNVGTSVRMYCQDCCAPQSHLATKCRDCCSTGHGTRQTEERPQPVQIVQPTLSKPVDLGEWWRKEELFRKYCDKRNQMNKDGPLVGEIISVLDWNDYSVENGKMLNPTQTRTGIPCFKVGTQDVLSRKTMEPEWIIYSAQYGLVAYYDKPLKKGSKVKVVKKTEVSITIEPLVK